ncbi:MAG: excinuclease ABC subunit UvrC [Methanosarcinaceae archaeon]|nr:excinuclease ABC subunit UvrC [Methanosarcinaceae archaeon]
MAIDLSRIPDAPGVYLMKDGSDNVIYVGKARSLTKRVRQYFQTQKYLSPKTRVLVAHIADLEYIITDSEVDALVLEANLIKKHKPRYNVQLRDDKRYPYLKVTVNSRFPRIYLTRRRLMDGALYFGPYTSVKPIRRTLDIISRIFGIRQCRKPINGKASRPCLNFHIKRCPGPCIGAVSEEEYRKEVMRAVRFLEGDTAGLLKELDQKMADLAQAQEYEAAAMVRDNIEAIRSLSSQQTATAGTDDRDVIAAAADENTVYVQLFYIRDGSLMGRADFALTRGGAEIPEALSEFIKQYYQDSPVPPEIAVQYEVPEKELIMQWLAQKSGRHVRVHVPMRGDKRRFLDMAAKNAEMSMKQAQLKGKPHDTALEALTQLKEVLSLGTLPHHIEAFDISNISGTDAVGSVVVFENGLPLNSEYRQFNIKTVTGMDDFAMIAEVVSRRYTRLVREQEPIPDLILIDGGPGQVSAAQRSLKELALDIPLIGLAKRYEHIITPKKGAGQVIILPRTSGALKLLMQVRDEAHRFAVASHRRKRTARLTHSELDAIPGIGTLKKRALLEHFGSVDRVGNASVEELMQVKGISKHLAGRITEHFKKTNGF